MRILGIETSCDETAVALYECTGSTGRILSERIASQIKTHARFGGVVPEVASREHLTALSTLVEEVMEDSGCEWPEIDRIAVTAGPGLMGALLVGVSYARALGEVNNIPVIPVHHMEGHLLAPGLSETGVPGFPFITLLVSGGHTMLVRVDAIGKYQIIGQTIDDAAGECFDKSARLLGLPYPGGPEISKAAEQGDASRYKLPRPLLNRDDLNFSFSGLKTAVMYVIKDAGEMDQQAKSDLAASIELAVCDVLVKKSIRACLSENVGNLVVAGGVAANGMLRKLLALSAVEAKIQVFLPDTEYCTDNAAMIAYAGFYAPCIGREGKRWDVAPRMPLDRKV